MDKPTPAEPTPATFTVRARAKGWPFACFAAEGFERPELAAATALWHDKAKGRAMPDRADMTARVMKPFLPQMTLLERLGGRYRVRLHGSALARYAGDSTGQFVDDFVRDGRSAGYVALYDFVLELGRPVRVVTHYQIPQISYLVGESLVAPLSGPQPLILSITYAKPRAARA